MRATEFIIDNVEEKLKNVSTKPRNFVAKNAMKTTSGAGAHRDKKKEQKQGDFKHKNQGVGEVTGDKPFDNMMKTISKGAARQATTDKKDQKTQSRQQSRDAFSGMFGGTSADLLKNLKIREQGVAEGTGETPQQLKVRDAISKGLTRSSQMGKAEYQSQPTNRTYFDKAGYASDKLTGIDSIDPDGTVVISMGDTRAANWVKKLATLGGMPGIKTREVQPKSAEGVAEGSKEDDPFEQGWQTFFRRGDYSDNPYEKGSPEYAQWLNGFREGESQPNHYESIAVSEKAPPGEKAERMVKHIKKAYARDGGLSDKERSTAYATAWKHHNK